MVMPNRSPQLYISPFGNQSAAVTHPTRVHGKGCLTAMRTSWSSLFTADVVCQSANFHAHCGYKVCTFLSLGASVLVHFQLAYVPLCLSTSQLYITLRIFLQVYSALSLFLHLYVETTVNYILSIFLQNIEFSLQYNYWLVSLLHLLELVIFISR